MRGSHDWKNLLPLNRSAAASLDGQMSRRGVEAIAGEMLPLGA